MRETFGSLIQTSKDFCVDDKTTSTTSLTSTELFLKREVNRTVRFMQTGLNMFKSRPEPRTFSTVANQQFYHFPPGLNVIETVKIDTGTVDQPLIPVHNQHDWDVLNSGVSITGKPNYIFVRQYDFGLYPIPQAVYTGTLVGNFIAKNMTADDYRGGTASIAQNSTSLTGSGSTWTSSMVGRWFSPTDSISLESNGSFYRVSAFSTTTAVTLESYFEESALSGSTYVIGESPELPEESQELIPYRVASVYYGTRRRDKVEAQKYANFFYTGDWENNRRLGRFDAGYLGIKQKYSQFGRDNSQVFEIEPVVRGTWLDEEWERATT